MLVNVPEVAPGTGDGEGDGDGDGDGDGEGDGDGDGDVPVMVKVTGLDARICVAVAVLEAFPSGLRTDTLTFPGLPRRTDGTTTVILVLVMLVGVRLEPPNETSAPVAKVGPT